MLKIQRLNMDNSWLLTFDNCSVLIDPWLIGAEIDYFPWFNKQWHRTKPISLNEVPNFDFCLITQKYPDHFHHETLKQLKIQSILGPKSIAKSVRNILPESNFLCFDKKIENIFNSGLNIHFLPTKRKIDPIYDALIIEDGKSSVVVATHGFSLTNEQCDLINGLPQVELVITPFNRYKLPAFLGGIVSPGIESVKDLILKTNARKVVATHDENKFAKGIVSKFAKITWAPKQEELLQIPEFENRLIHIEDYGEIEL